jgi:alkanesulfonate monooxygenase SsuD/methylene tetrahydromethanopterin reductase-like flavin-dependent oxidoreductase (luciferase family)
MDTVVLAGAAAATSRIELSSNIMLATVWPAVLLAKELASIDAMSGGRLTLGIGIGGDRPDDFVVDGLPARRLGKRIDADLATYHDVWRGEPVGGGTSPAVPTNTRRIPLLFGGMAEASVRRMAKWGEGYVGGGLPIPLVEPMFDAARKAWKDVGRPGAPKLVAVAYFAFGDVEKGRANVYDYYSINGEEFARSQAQGVRAGADEVRELIKAYEETGADELILHPGVADIHEVGRLAEAAL